MRLDQEDIDTFLSTVPLRFRALIRMDEVAFHPFLYYYHVRVWERGGGGGLQSSEAEGLSVSRAADLGQPSTAGINDCSCMTFHHVIGLYHQARAEMDA